MKRFAAARTLDYSLPVTIGNENSKTTFQCAVCADPVSRSLGLMGQQLPARSGCLITFPYQDHHALWMKDCLHPLCALFFDQQGCVVDKVQMDHTTPNVSYRPKVPAMFVVEIHPEEAGVINIGDKIYAPQN